MVRPDPIPNSAVKRSVADGSAGIACVRVGSRQIFLKTSNLPVRRFCLPRGSLRVLFEVRFGVY